MAEEEGGTTAFSVIGDSCCGDTAAMLVYACSGASNVGQVANGVMVELNKGGYGKAGCLSGVGAGLSGFVESAKAGRSIVIDGCPTACGKKIFEKLGIEPYKYFVVTDFGIKKTHDFSLLESETKEATGLVLSNI
jgi:uncharacterized metal-binding protein